MKAQKVWFENGHIYIIAADGREGNLPVRLFPRLYNASEEQLQKFTLSHHGIHWMELDEDLSYEGFFSEENVSREKNPLKNIFFKFPELIVVKWRELLASIPLYFSSMSMELRRRLPKE